MLNVYFNVVKDTLYSLTIHVTPMINIFVKYLYFMIFLIMFKKACEAVRHRGRGYMYISHSVGDMKVTVLNMVNS